LGRELGGRGRRLVWWNEARNDLCFTSIHLQVTMWSDMQTRGINAIVSSVGGGEEPVEIHEPRRDGVTFALCEAALRLSEKGVHVAILSSHEFAARDTMSSAASCALLSP